MRAMSNNQQMDVTITLKGGQWHSDLNFAILCSKISHGILLASSSMALNSPNDCYIEALTDVANQFSRKAMEIMDADPTCGPTGKGKGGDG
jgi:hypothetical protein